MKMQNNAKLAFRIGSLLGMQLLIIHWLGCVWYLVVQTPGSWFPVYDPSIADSDFYGLETLRQYAVMVYYSFQMIVGSELNAQNIYQDLFVCSITVLGAMWMAFLFGSIAATVASMSSKENYYEDQVNIVTQSMQSIKLEEKRQQEVIQYIELMKENPSVNPQDMDRFFNLLS